MTSTANFPGAILREINDQEHRRAVRIPGYATVQTPTTTRCISDSGQGYVFWQDACANPKNLVREEIDSHRAHGTKRLTWKVYSHDHPAALAEELVAQGFDDEGTPNRVAARSVGRIPASALPSGYAIRRLDRAEDLELLIALYDQIWPDEDNALWLAGYAQPLAEGADGLHLYVVMDAAGQPVASGGMIHAAGQRCGHLFGGGTHPGHRRRGLHRRLIAERARTLKERGGQWLIVDAGNQSWPGLADLGFQEISQVRFYSRLL